MKVSRIISDKNFGEKMLQIKIAGCQKPLYKNACYDNCLNIKTDRKTVIVGTWCFSLLLMALKGLDVCF